MRTNSTQLRQRGGDITLLNQRPPKRQDRAKYWQYWLKSTRVKCQYLLFCPILAGVKTHIG